MEEIAAIKELTKNYYYLSTDYNQWKQLVDLTTYVYEGIQNINQKQ